MAGIELPTLDHVVRQDLVSRNVAWVDSEARILSVQVPWPRCRVQNLSSTSRVLMRYWSVKISRPSRYSYAGMVLLLQAHDDAEQVFLSFYRFFGK